MYHPIIPGLALLVISLSAVASEPGERRRGPPPEALEACAELQEGDECSFVGRNATVAGICAAPADRPLACAPEGGPPDRRPEMKRD